MDDLPRPDQVPGALHPRETPQVFGHDAAERAVIDALQADRLHHAWLISGPKGIGKASFAWRMAKFLLTHRTDEDALFGPAPVTSMDTDGNHPVVRRALADAEPRLLSIIRGWNEKTKKLRQDITVDEVRKLRTFFGLSAADGGKRVVLIDAADELNTSAANAVLKVLEEPPKDAILLLVSHQPSRLLPTIRSRCRTLRLSPLGPDDLTAALGPLGVDSPSQATLALAQGSVGRAFELMENGGGDIYAGLIGLFSDLPRVSRPNLTAMADSTRARGAETQADLLFEMASTFMARLARTGAIGPPQTEAAPGEAAILQKLSPHAGAARAWAHLHQTQVARITHGRAVNLDASALFLDMALEIEHTSAQILG